MVTRTRSVTAKVLLVSYLLASAAAWLHVTHQCGHGPCAQSAYADLAQDLCGGHHHCCGHETSRSVAASESATSRAQFEGSGGAPAHLRDECTFCQFQLGKKLVLSSAVDISLTLPCPEQRVPELARCPVAKSPVSFDSRAPPSQV